MHQKISTNYLIEPKKKGGAIICCLYMLNPSQCKKVKREGGNLQPLSTRTRKSESHDSYVLKSRGCHIYAEK